jgi:hypothetical protein
MAAREAEIRVPALDAIDEAITKFRSDTTRTEKKLIAGEWVEVPVMLITPRDVALLIDRFQILFARPSVISQHQGLNVTSEMLPIDALQAIIERTRGLAEPAHGLHRSRERRAAWTTERFAAGAGGFAALEP